MKSNFDCLIQGQKEATLLCERPSVIGLPVCVIFLRVITCFIN